MSTEPVPFEVETLVLDLDADRRALLYPVLDTVRDAMPDGYRLGVYNGILGWVVPLETYPHTRDKQPLVYVSLAAHKSYNSLYLMALYSFPEKDAAFRADWAATGRALNMGTSSVRFKSLADLDLDLIAREVASVSVEEFIANYERVKHRA
ncbi:MULTISPECIES: DUF1801 domain-containing protein [Cryobacterium]|uniref:DUF1801 domain-containing protein n=1 Tax=Cryobacterium breve TaxID=1259258 RepID=A0ABY2IZV7_9MICO|nr:MULTISPECIES: DUF1801 domain-containing protein [Cryobacterium]TFC92941.1 DUF1801 domain-containing protein [Cryobacterium sp. TmT3-12]TFC97884.1 DUF1801 domain-containing protein [Cryobacterium breve]